MKQWWEKRFSLSHWQLTNVLVVSCMLRYPKPSRWHKIIYKHQTNNTFIPNFIPYSIPNNQISNFKYICKVIYVLYLSTWMMINVISTVIPILEKDADNQYHISSFLKQCSQSNFIWIICLTNFIYFLFLSRNIYKNTLGECLCICGEKTQPLFVDII